MQQPRIAPEVLTAAIWDALKSVPGVVDLHRNPLQALGERVKLDRLSPVRLIDDDEQALEVHIVVAEGQPIPPIAQAAREALRQYTAKALGMPGVPIHLFIDDTAPLPSDT